MKEIWLRATHSGQEYARIFIASHNDEKLLEHELEVFERNGCGRHEGLKKIVPYGCTFTYFVVTPAQDRHMRMETASEEG